jgi:hypothetical protein
MDYDENKMETQSKTILELQNDIKEYQKRERAYLIKLHLKEKEIRHLENYKNDLIKKVNNDIISLNKPNSNSNTSNVYLDPLMLNEFKTLKNILKEKDALLLARDEEINSLITNQNHPLFKKLVSKCKELHKENMELYSYTQGGTLENLRHENGLERDQIDQLMLKLKEKDNIHFELENEADEVSETVSILGKKLKELEEKSVLLEKEYKESRGVKSSKGKD